MDALLFHPKVVHIPMALGVLMPAIAGVIALGWWRRWLPSRAWLSAVALQAVLLVSGLVALGTGQAEEERVERVVAEGPIEAHEEAAELFVWGSGAVLAMMLAAAALDPKRAALPFAGVATLGTLVVLGLGYRTGQAGGSLVYQHGAGQVYGAAQTLGALNAATPRADDD